MATWIVLYIFDCALGRIASKFKSEHDTATPLLMENCLQWFSTAHKVKLNSINAL